MDSFYSLQFISIDLIWLLELPQNFKSGSVLLSTRLEVVRKNCEQVVEALIYWINGYRFAIAKRWILFSPFDAYLMYIFIDYLELDEKLRVYSNHAVPSKLLSSRCSKRYNISWDILISAEA